MTHSFPERLVLPSGPRAAWRCYAIARQAWQTFLSSECLVHLVCHLDGSVTLDEGLVLYEALPYCPQVTRGETAGTSPS